MTIVKGMDRSRQRLSHPQGAWLGDQAIFRIRLPESFGDSGKIAVRRLFPEARVEPMPLEGEIVLRPSATDAEFERHQAGVSRVHGSPGLL